MGGLPKEFIENPFGELFRHLGYVYCFSHDSLSVAIERSSDALSADSCPRASNVEVPSDP